MHCQTFAHPDVGVMPKGSKQKISLIIQFSEVKFKKYKPNRYRPATIKDANPYCVI
jgi:hypothetical protein